MISPLTHKYLRKLLLVSLCLAFGAVAVRAQNTGGGSGSVDREIERLQRILELEREIESLRQQARTESSQGVATQTTQTPQTPQYPQTPRLPQTPQTPSQGVVSFTPVDTGRSAVTFTIGEPAAKHDRYALKMNMLYGIGLMAPNIGLDVAIGEHTTIGVAGGYSNWHNMWDFSDKGPDYDPGNTYKRRLDHFSAGAEFRYWFRRRFEGHFVGVNALWTKFMVGEAKVPPLFEKMTENDGYLYGGGFTYGYLWQIAPRWGVEFTIGAGIAIVEHDQRPIDFGEGSFALGDPERFRKTFVGPTSAGITIVFKL